MRSFLLFGSGLIASIVMLTADNVAAQQRKCIYWFGVCASCEAPLTCTNSRPVKPKSTVIRKYSSQAARVVPREDHKSGQVASQKPALPKREPQVKGALFRGPITSDEEFRQFSAYMRSNSTAQSELTGRELVEMYFRYKLWSMEERNRRSKAE